MADSKSIGWGLIGASDIAKTRMIAAINGQPDSAVVAVMSMSEERAKRYAAENGIPHSYASVEALLADRDVDVVYVSTTNERHKHEVTMAASAGKHVLCEKPLALTMADAREMLERCKRASVVLGTNHHLRNAVTHRTLRRLIKEGAIGKPLAARVFHAVYLPPRLQGWRLETTGAGGGVILDITVHDADTLHFALDDDAEEVVALSGQQGLAKSGLEDAVMGAIRFRSGLLAQFHDAFTIKHTRTGFEVHGTEGSLIAEDVMTQEPRGQLFLQKDEKREEVELGEHEDLYARQVRHFNAAVNGRGTPFATAEDGVRSLALATAVLESAKTGQRVAVQY
ncbi:MAG: Gfo/Idh/MocA family oxidoreductase [Verrucomicrobia bacterium]|nr:Gfo/Idh/MocA family oxidoreductase [Verrucomicrobiota bacterium]